MTLDAEFIYCWVLLCLYPDPTLHDKVKNSRTKIRKRETNIVNLYVITIEAMTEIVEETLSELRQTFKSGRTRSVAWRKTQLTALLQLIKDNEEKVFEALYQDLGKHPVEAYRDEVRSLVFDLMISYSL